MVTARRQIITSARLGMPLTGLFEATYGKVAALDNSKIDIFSFLHFSDCLSQSVRIPAVPVKSWDSAWEFTFERLGYRSAR